MDLTQFTIPRIIGYQSVPPAQKLSALKGSLGGRRVKDDPLPMVKVLNTPTSGVAEGGSEVVVGGQQAGGECGREGRGLEEGGREEGGGRGLEEGGRERAGGGRGLEEEGGEGGRGLEEEGGREGGWRGREGARWLLVVSRLG